MSTRGRCRAVTALAVVNTAIWGRTEALSMLVNLSARRTFLSLSRASISRVAVATGVAAQRRTGREFAVTWVGRLAWNMATPVSPELSVEDRVDDAPSACPLRDNAVSEKLAQAQPLASGAQADTGSTVMARVVPAEEPWLSEAGARLRAGKLVAFPTETVYGLGANALSESAVLKIFEAKRRPLTDPLIVHIPDTASALSLVDFEGEGGGDKARQLLALLGDKLWPGPLTLILKAADGIPACVTANTGFVGVRCPAHPVARQLLSLAGVPVAAPSANRFGHVSPTKAAHVTEDLGESDIVVINGDSSGACGVGIESTVAKLDVDNHRILILRMGGVTQAKLQETLAAGGEEFAEISVLAGSVAGGKSSTEKVATPSEPGQPLSEVEGQAPGQLLKHYSPDLEVFRVVQATPQGTGSEGVGVTNGAKLAGMARTSVVIDFAGQLKELEALALAYADLSASGDAEEAATGLFEALRWAEARPLAQRLLICGLPSSSNGDMAAAVNDRIYRAASGKTISSE